MKKVICINTYRPHDGDIPTFINHLKDVLGSIPDLHKYEIVLSGDMNIDVKGDSDEKDSLYSALKPHKLTQQIKGITRYSTKPNTKDSTLDLIFTNIDCIADKGILNNHLSDHLPVFITRKKVHIKVEKIEVTGRSYLKINNDLLRKGLDGYDWSIFDNSENVETCWTEYVCAITAVLDKHCPIKRFSVPKNDDPWMSNEMYERMRDKNALLTKARISKTLGYKKAAAKARNASNRMNDRARRDYVKDTLEENGNNHKKFWRIINSILPGQNSGKKEIRLVDEDTGENIPPDKTGDFINEYFINIGLKLAANLYIPWKFYDPICNTEIDEFRTNLQEVKNLIHNININKSSAIDNIS